MKKIILSLSVFTGLSAFAQYPVDTTGIESWNTNHNSFETWYEGAFDDQKDGSPFDIGWGIYNSTTHHINGDSLHIIQLQDGSYKQVFIENLVSGSFNFHYANLDGTNATSVVLPKSDFTGKNFGHYSIENEETRHDLEPLSAEWDILFTGYNRPSDGYGVTGILTNHHIEIAEARNIDTNDVDPSTLTYSEAINVIGYDWKSFNMGTFSYDIEDSLSYYLIEDDDTSVLVLHGFSGSAGGGVIDFTINGVMKQVTMGAGYINRVFFDLENDEVLSTERSLWDIAFDGSGYGTTIRTNEAMGIKLWVYPGNDNSAWLTVKEQESALSIFNIYPNPATDVCNINLGGNKTGAIDIQVIDMSGRTVYANNVSINSGMTQHAIDISNFDSGIYNIVLTDDSGRNVGFEKMIKK